MGRENGVGVGNIVGAIANEANIDSRFIGQIQLFDQVTTVDLPDGMPKDVLSHLKKVRVCGRPLNIREAGDEVFVDSGRGAPRKPRSDRPRGDRPRGDRPAGAERRPRKPRDNG